MATTTSLADAKNRLSEIVASAEKTHERTVITKNGKPVAMVMSIDDWEGVEETMDILSNPEWVAAIGEGVAEADRGEFATDDEMRKMFHDLGLPLPKQLQQ